MGISDADYSFDPFVLSFEFPIRAEFEPSEGMDIFEMPSYGEVVGSSDSLGWIGDLEWGRWDGWEI